MKQEDQEHLQQLFTSLGVSYKIVATFDDVTFVVEEKRQQSDNNSNNSEEKKKNTIGWLFFHKSDKSVNTLDRDLMDKVTHIFDQVETEYLKSNELDSVIFYSLRKGFIVGADVNMIYSITDPSVAQQLSSDAHSLLFRFEQLTIPAVAAIHGNCLGGGLEVALSCSHRVASDNKSTCLGLPEIKLGIIPGTGGTVRLPRIIGLSTALQMILTGASVNSNKAHKTGIVDQVIPFEGGEEAFFARVRQYTIELVKNKAKIVDKYWRRSIPVREIVLERNYYGRRLIEYQTRKSIDKLAKGKYPAPYIALDTVMKAYAATTVREATKIEAENFGKIVCTNEAKYFIELFQTMEATKKIENICGTASFPKIKRIGVVGTGTMGSALTQLAAYKSYQVYMKGMDEHSVKNGMIRVNKLFQTLEKRGRITEQEKQACLDRISSGTSFVELANTDLIIDAALAGEATISQILKEVEHSNLDMIFATNSCSVTVKSIASGATRKHKVLGLQFLNPVYRVPMVEIVRTEHTSQEALGSVYQFALSLGKSPVVVNDGPGFLLTRLYAVYCSQAIRLLSHGWSFETIDRSLESFGLQMGPFQVMDESGIDVCSKIFPGILNRLGMGYDTCTYLKQLAESDKALGKKSGKGFYLYDKSGKKLGPNPAIRLSRASSDRRAMAATELDTRQQIIDYCILSVVNESARCIEERIVTKPEHIDLALVLGFGFPPFRGGGALGYCDLRGAKEIVERLKELTRMFQSNAGETLQPSPILCRMASNNERFYPERQVLAVSGGDIIPKSTSLIPSDFFVMLLAALVVPFLFIMLRWWSVL